MSLAKGAKKEKFHTEATEVEYDLLESMIDKHHEDFGDSEIKILMRHGGWQSKGKPVYAKFKVLGEDFRSTWGKDAILYINADLWHRLTEPQKRYVLDHALYALDIKCNKHGDVLEAADGRPLLKTVPPDIEAYFEVIRRHGPVTEDVKRLAIAIKEIGPEQLTIDDAAPLPLPEPHEGISGTIDADGTVTVVDDPNQVTIDLLVEEQDPNVPPLA